MSRGNVVSVTRWLVVAGIVLETLVIIGFVLGPSGIGWTLPDSGPLELDGEAIMNVSGTLSAQPQVDVDLTWHTTSDGATDVNTGLPAVELVGPSTAGVSFLNPTPLQRTAYVVARIVVPLAVILVLWSLYRLVTSVQMGTPFTMENGHRLRTIALVVMVGGTLGIMVSRWLDNWLIATSPAAVVFNTQPGPIPLTPLLIGLLLVVLSLVWNHGVALQEDTKGLV